MLGCQIWPHKLDPYLFVNFVRRSEDSGYEHEEAPIEP